MIDGSEKRNRQLAFELQNSHVCEKRSKGAIYLLKKLKLFSYQLNSKNNCPVLLLKIIFRH